MKERKENMVMSSIEFLKMAKSLRLYPDHIPFNIVSKVIALNESNRFTIEQFGEALNQMIEMRNAEMETEPGADGV